jgi:glycosyltransferase involved in cell wall biosynthesis
MVVHAYYPHTETRVQRQAERLVDAGYQVDVVCLRARGELRREQYRGVEVHRLPAGVHKSTLAAQLASYVWFAACATAYVGALERRHHYDSVQVHNLPDFLVVSAAYPKLRRVPVVLDLHDLMPEFFAGRFGSARSRLLARLVAAQERLACRAADRVVTVSDHWVQALVARGVPREKCHVVMNVADERIFTPQSPAGGAGLRLVYHGTATERYGLDLALRAVARVRHDVPGVHLTILGRGDHMPALFALRRELGLEPWVDLRDEHVVAERLPAIIGRAHVGVVPYRDDVFTDGLLPTKLMEYAAMGLPCIASRTTAIERYFRDTMVEFFTPGDADDLARAIRYLATDPMRRRALAAGSVRFTDRYNWRTIGDDYVAMVRSLSPRAQARPPSPVTAGQTAS